MFGSDRLGLWLLIKIVPSTLVMHMDIECIVVYDFSPKVEKLKCWDIIDEYLANYPVPRDISTPHAVIFQGLEPSTFIGYFDQWDKKLWDVSSKE